MNKLENELLLCHAYGITRAELYAHPARYNNQDTRYKEFLRRRQNHEPIAYITGYQPFLGLDMIVTPDVLIPRPETEYMVETFLNTPYLNAGYLRCVADIGTGSGCIAVAIAKYLPKVTVYAIDSSEKALEVAKTNAQKHGVSDRIKFLKGHLFEPLNENIDLVISNPPYIPTADLPTLMPDVRDYEPVSALDGGPDGLTYIRELISQFPVPSSQFLLEFGSNQAASVLELAHPKFPDAKILKDQFGLDRYLLAYKS